MENRPSSHHLITGNSSHRAEEITGAHVCLLPFQATRPLGGEKRRTARRLVLRQREQGDGSDEDGRVAFDTLQYDTREGNGVLLNSVWTKWTPDFSLS